MSGGIFSPLLHYDNKQFSVLGQLGRGWSVRWFVGTRHLLVTGKDAVYHHPAVWIFISFGLNG